MNIFPAPRRYEETTLAIHDNQHRNASDLEFVKELLNSRILEWDRKPWHVRVVFLEVIFILVRWHIKDLAFLIVDVYFRVEVLQDIEEALAGRTPIG